MATKYILIDHEKYKALLNRNSGDYFQTKADSLLQNPNLNDTYKNIFYDAALKQLIRKKKEKEDEPLNVKFDPALLNSFLKQEMEEKNAAITDQLFDPFSKKSTKSDSNYSLPEKSDSTAATQFSSSTAPTQLSSNYSIPEISEKRTPDFFANLVKAKTPRARKNVKEQKALDESLINQISDYMYENRNQYGITDKGEILDANQLPIKGSNYKSSAQRLVHPTSPGQSSPKGHKKIKQVAKNDVKLQNYLKKFKPTNWSTL